ncbi:MAG: C40 family peptidase [Pyrinomonadaceae bacterium]
MKDLKKIFVLSSFIVLCAVCFTVAASAQGRDRVVRTTSSQPTNMPPAPPKQQPASRSTLTNDVIIVGAKPEAAPLVKRTASSKAVNAPGALSAGRTVYGMSTSVRLDRAIKERYGLPYRYGSTGPNSYDCSGFVWSSFQEAGIFFTRQSARSLWSQSEPVYGDDRFKFGTLVFFNNLGHMGIVADENGFYQASSSKGITYSPFAGYWASRIVGYRRLKPESGTMPEDNQ